MRSRSGGAVGPAIDLCIWACLGLTAVVLAVRGFGLDPSWVMAPLLAVLPLLVIATCVVGLVAAARRNGRQLAVTLLVLLLSAPAVAPRMIADPQPTPDGPVLTVAVANIKRGRVDPARLVQLVRELDVDVLVTIELTPAAVRRLHAAGLDELLPNVVREPIASRSGGGVRSRFPLTQTGTPAPGGGEPDVLVAVPGADPLHITTTHPRPPINARFAADWRRVLSQLPAPGEALDDGDSGGAALLAGDLNATLDHPQLRALLDRGWRDAAEQAGAGMHPTYTGLRRRWLTPPLAIDHILVSERVAVLDVSTHTLPGSDHRMLVSKLRLPGPR